MCDDDGRAILHELFEWFLEKSFCLSIKGTSRLIEDEDRSILQKCSSDREALPLSSGELHSPLSDKRIESIRESRDEFSDMRFFDDFFESFFGYFFLTEDDILPDRRIEETIILKYDSDIGAQGVLRDRTDIDTVDEDLPWLDIVESEEEIGRGSLAWAGMPDECDFFPCFDLEWDFFEDFSVRLIGESDIFEADISLHTWQFFRIVRFSHLWLGLKSLEEFSRRRSAPEKSIDWPHDTLDRWEKQCRIPDKHDDLTESDESIEIEIGSERDHSDRDDDCRDLRKANNDSPPSEYWILECESLIEESIQGFHTITPQSEALHCEDIGIRIDIVCREFSVVFLYWLLISKCLGRRPESKYRTEESCNHHKSSESPIEKEHTWDEEEDREDRWHELPEYFEEYIEDIVSPSHELFPEFPRVGIIMKSDWESECMRKISSDNRIELLMCHTIRIDRHEELQYDDGESDSAPDEESITKSLWHLTRRETLLERDDTIDHISEKYRLKQEERREEEIREDEKKYCFLSLSEEKENFFECLEHMNLSVYL